MYNTNSIFMRETSPPYTTYQSPTYANDVNNKIVNNLRKMKMFLTFSRISD